MLFCVWFLFLMHIECTIITIMLIFFFAYALQYLAVSLADASTRRRKFQMKNKLPNTHIMAFKSLSDTTAHIQCNDILGKIEIFHMVRMHWKLLNNIAYHYRAPDLIAAKYTATYKQSVQHAHLKQSNQMNLTANESHCMHICGSALHDIRNE